MSYIPENLQTNSDDFKFIYNTPDTLTDLLTIDYFPADVFVGNIGREMIGKCSVGSPEEAYYRLQIIDFIPAEPYSKPLFKQVAYVN